MKTKLFTLLLVLFVAGLPYITNAQFVPNDEVELLRDEPLLFNTAIYRQGNKGERFRVAAYRADIHKVFILATDAKGKSFALNVPAAAVGPVGRDVGMLNDQAFAALRAGRLEEAQKLMLQVPMLDRERSVCTEVATHLGRISTAQVAYQQGLKQQQATQVEVQRRMRNATVADQPNALDRTDNSNQVRAAQMRKEAEQLSENSKAAIESKQEQIAAELKLLSAVAKKRETAGAYGEALDINEVVATLASRQPLGHDRSDSFRGFGRQELQKKAAEAQKHLEDARRNVSVKKLSGALQSVGAGLGAEPGSYSLRRLQGEISQRLDASGKAYATAFAHQQLKHYEEALKALEQARAECTDHEASETLAATLKKTLAEKDDRTAKAKTAEAAGNFAAALETYETYALDSDAKRVLPMYAKQRETEGDFLLAYSLYERAGLSAETQRVQAKKEQQLAEYGKAKVLIVEGKFAEALAIYRQFKDSTQEKEALRQQGAFYEGQGKFDEAIGVYREAQLAEEVARVKNFVASRAGLLADAAQQEQAANYDKAIDLFQQANAKNDVKRVAENMAKKFEEKKDYESAAEYFEVAGLYEEAGRIRNTHDLSQSASRGMNNEQILKRCKPKCVTVTSAKGLGTGFFIAKGGYILTNNHVVAGATKVTIQLENNDKVSATVIASSRVPDAALLKVEKDRNYPFLQIGDSDTVQDGSAVSAIGSGEGYTLKFKPGVISGSQVFFKNQCFQTTVPINHGDSGSPLLNGRGQVIGINTFTKSTAAILDDGQQIGSGVQSITFAIKINEAKKLLKDNIPGF